MKNSISNIATRVSLKAQSLKDSAKKCLDNEDGDFYISEGVKVIIAVILGSLLITAMVALFNSQIIPGIQRRSKPSLIPTPQPIFLLIFLLPDDRAVPA